MTKIQDFVLAASAAFVFTAGVAPAGYASANNANAAATKLAAAAPTKEALMVMALG